MTASLLLLSSGYSAHVSYFSEQNLREKNKEKFPRLAKAFLMRVAESDRIFYIFGPMHACMKYPLQRHHESYSVSLTVKIGRFEQTCPELSKVINQLDLFEHVGVFTQSKAPPTRPKDACVRTTLCLPAGRKLRDAPPF